MGSLLSCGSGHGAQPEDAHKRFLDVDQLALSLMLLSRTVGESFFQQQQVAAEFELRENQTAQCLQRFFLLGRQFARRAIHDAKCSECVTIFVNKRSEEHTSELQSRVDLVCRLLLEK